MRDGTQPLAHCFLSLPTHSHKGDRVRRSVTFGVHQLWRGIFTHILEAQQEISIVCCSLRMGGLGAL